MRTFSYRWNRALTTLAALCLTFTLAACDPPWRGEITAEGANAEFGSAQAALDALEKHSGGETMSGMCSATDLSTVLDPVPPSTGSSPVNVRIHYRRDDAQYGDWGLHLWQVNDAGQYISDYPGVSWNTPFARTGIDSYGAYFDLPATAFDNPAAAGFGFIVHPRARAATRAWIACGNSPTAASSGCAPAIARSTAATR